MDNFNDIANMYILNMINDHKVTANNPRTGLSVKYDQFILSDYIFKKKIIGHLKV